MWLYRDSGKAMDTNSKNNEVVLSDSIFTPVMDVKTATQGFKDFQKLKMEILTESDIIEIMGKPHVKKSGWNKLALFFGASTKTVSSKKTYNPDGSYEWEVTVEAYKRNKDGIELFNVQRSALVSSLEKEKTQAMKDSPRKSHDVFASAETRAEGRALAAFFGTGEVSAEEMEEMEHQAPAKPKIEYCGCALKDTKISETLIDQPGMLQGLHMCKTCAKPISDVRFKQVEKMLTTSTPS